jgi:flagellar motor protein MotB
MSVTQTVVKQSSSYRQGLVLGLTMAEVVLLIVFALLIALAAVWRKEHQENMRLQAEKTHLETRLTELDGTSSLPQLSPPDLQLLSEMRAALSSPDHAKAAASLERALSGQNVPTLSESEAQYVSEIRDQIQKGDQSEIDKNWRELVLASSVNHLTQKLQLSEAVMHAAPGELNPAKVEELIVIGQRSQKEGEHDWPPIITLHEADGFSFAKGKADLSTSFEAKLRDEIIPNLVALTNKFHVDVIEVIGHTDEQAIAQRPSNLDWMLVDALKEPAPVAALVPGDNAGLGLSRAVAVVRAIMLDGRLPQPQYRILPLSGGQLIDTIERITPGGGRDAPSRRRIEIRLRRSQESLGRN